jgi:hypothetical protein
MRIAHFIPAYRRQLRVEVAVSVAEDAVWCARQSIEHTVFWADMHGIARARNRAVEDAIAAGCDFLLMQDGDTWPMETPALPRLLHVAQMMDASVVGAVVRTRNKSGVNCEPARPGDVYEGEVGTAYLLLNLRRLLTIPRPWFSFQIAADGYTVEQSEDIAFCRLVKGHRQIVAVDYTLSMAHGGESTLELIPRHAERQSADG